MATRLMIGEVRSFCFRRDFSRYAGHCIAAQRCYSQSFNSTAVSPNVTPQYDVVIVGAGIVGMATAQEVLSRYPSLKCAVLEKEHEVAFHQSSNNSGVIHAGIYYQPGSLRAKLCIEGLKLMYEYCDKHNVPYNKCGKLIVATTPEEVSRLNGLLERGQQNGVPDLSIVDAEGIREIEPYCVGLKAIHSPHTGIVDYGEVTKSYAKNFQNVGGDILLGRTVSAFEETTGSPEYPLRIKCKNSYKFFSEEYIDTKYLITCGGLHSDRLAEKSGGASDPRIVPFRGEYLLLKPEKKHLVRGNIYPVPNPKFPFLGVHFTPRMNGDIWLGPNAVLAFKREGYKLEHVGAMDLLDAISYSGLRKLVLRNLGYAFGELYRGINISAQVEKLKQFVPELSVSDVTRGPAGVRAQALGPDGAIVEDFVFDSGPQHTGSRMLHVRNAPSPAATSSLAIAKMVVDKATGQFGL